MATTPAGADLRIRADYAQAALVLPRDQRWVPSPQPGVERVMLDREGGEIGRATSIVRYLPGSQFPRHTHGLGEEILVLEGTFSEGQQDHGAGTYLRNPPGSSHQPSSAHGTTLFVKLGQMQPGEASTVRIDTRDPSRWVPCDGGETCALFSGAAEQVSLERLAPGAALVDRPVQGAEMLVLAGELRFAGQACPARSWLRLPPGTVPPIVAGEHGATVYLKTGHLAHARANS